MTDSDRRLVITAAAALAGLALLAGTGLASVTVLRLGRGEDIAPGIAALVMALFGLTGTAVAFLCPSPLSKTATAPDGSMPVTVANEPVDVVDVSK